MNFLFPQAKRNDYSFGPLATSIMLRDGVEFDAHLKSVYL